MRQVACLLLLVAVGCGPSRDELVKQLEAELKLLEHNEKEMRQLNGQIAFQDNFKREFWRDLSAPNADAKTVSKRKAIEAEFLETEQKQQQAKNDYHNSRDKVDALKKQIAELDGR